MLLLVACAGGGSARNEDQQPQLLDEDGVVQDWEFWFVATVDVPVTNEEADIIEDAGAALLEPPAGWDLRVAWTTLPCQTAPIVTVRSSGSEITEIAVAYGPQVGVHPNRVVPVVCPSSNELHGVDLKVAEPIADGILVTGEDYEE